MDVIHIEQIRADLTWRIRHEVLYPNMPFEQIRLEEDGEGMHFGLFAKNQLLSVVSLFRSNDSYQFRKFATVEAEQGNGYGSKLLAYIIDYVRFAHGKKLWCNARLSAIAFYKKFGFVETDTYFTRDYIDFVVMELVLD